MNLKVSNVIMIAVIMKSVVEVSTLFIILCVCVLIVKYILLNDLCSYCHKYDRLPCDFISVIDVLVIISVGNPY